jgi:putative N6-adenine-specific DNA methylase
MHTKTDDFKLIAKTIFGLEEVLATELLKLGARDIEKLNRAVSFTGDKGMIYKTNLCLRTALRILVPVTQFEMRDEQSLYEGIKNIAWEDYMDVNDTLAVDCVLNTVLFKHTQYISQKTKDAIVDRFREKQGKRPNVDLDKPTLRINIHVYDTTCSVSFDSSGESLHKRGYREQTNIAPINEVLAAGLILLSGWDGKSNFIDPMCGTGTILIEAAMFAAKIPPGYYRPDYGFMRWKKYLGFDEMLWKTIYDANINRIVQHTPPILGGEISHHVARKAKENLKIARVDDMISIREGDILDFDAPPGKGTVIINPPYGERMDKDDLTVLYKTIGDAFKKRFTGYDCWIITSNMEALKFVGLRASRKIIVYNGPLECRFVKYEMYQGTKKHKMTDDKI